VDAGYRGEDKGADWVEKTLGWSVDLLERPRKAAPEEVLKSWAREWAKEGIALDWQNLLTPTTDFSVIDPYRMPRTDGSAEKPTRPIAHAWCMRVNINATRCNGTLLDRETAAQIVSTKLARYP
jgi:hypothetical protein